uniref:E3 ubiquitin-protein ligase MARCHF6 n=1 Tax=Strigamia maritima TaxID=126957 RepID=T1J4X4_STRMM
MDDNLQQDICRVCRSEGTPDRPLFHPCICTGSIKFIHQECLVQWLKYSRKEYCELCNHRFSFTPIYAPDMPKRLPIKDIVSGLLTSIGTAIRYWFHYTLVAFAWLGVVPISSYRIYRYLFTGSVSSVLTLPFDLLSTENLLPDSFHGCFVVTCTLCGFISLVWLREQILHGGGPDWLDNLVDNNNGNAQVQNNENEAVQPEANDDVVEANDEAANGGNEANVAAQEDNWNPIEWERAAEELTWERLLGLDGSLVFLEHVFWVVSLNTLFIFVFAFCPYHIGHFTIIGFDIKDFVKTENVAATQFEGLLTTLCGYIVIGTCLVILHGLASIIRLKRSKRILGLCYVVIKVSLLSIVEIGVFPLVCGWWLDICSLAIFDATLKDREASFRMAPGTSMFIHWLVGMVYIFYFASFVLLLREVVRPGVLWFLRNLNDPDFSPIQEMIHLPLLRHARRFLISMVIFGTTVLIMLWIPINVIRKYWPGFLPYNVVLSSETPVSELSLELLLLQVILPALMEQGHTRVWLRGLVRTWCLGVSWVLDLHSYLLGDEAAVKEENEPEQNENNAANEEPLRELPAPPPPPPLPPPPPPPPPPVLPVHVEENGGFLPGALGAAHQALLQVGGPTGFQPYRRPTFFTIRIICLLVIMCFSLTIVSLITLTLPVFCGRKIMTVWLGSSQIHELYTAACGLYACWLSVRLITLLCSWIPQGWGVILDKLKQWTILATKTAFAMVLLIGLIPLLLGLLFELVVVVPLRVPLTQSPIFFVWQDWALGVLHTKIICAVTMMGPDWWLKRVIERVYQDGIRNMRLRFIIVKLVIPVVVALGLTLAIPYAFACTIVPTFGVSFDARILVMRRIYPALLATIVFTGLCFLQMRQFWRLYEHIKNDKYLVGKRLVNYDHKARSSQQSHDTRPTPPPHL